LDALRERERALRQAVEEKSARLADIETGLEKLRRVREILTKEERGRLLEQLQQTAAFHELEQCRDRAAQWVADVEAIQTATGKAAREEAAAKLGAAERTIDTFFRQLTRHPAIQRIRLQVTEARQRNHYAITDDGGQDLTPVLSQGDLNALALSIFLGLASADGGQGAFGFVMLDDPSQSLGSEHKKALVEILDTVSRDKQIVLATMDVEFRDLLLRGLTRSKQEYVFASWSVANGPTLVPW
jgi:DNA repair exonuclease SbcCD ATPase subunit